MTGEQILVFRALQLGDMLCAMPALRTLRSLYPSATISLVALPWAQQLLPRFSHCIDEVLTFPGFPGLPECAPDCRAFPDFLKQVQDRRFDLALQLHGSGGLSNPLVQLFAARQSAGFYQPGAWCPDPASFWPYPDGRHEIHRNLALLEHLGAKDCDDTLDFPLLASDYQELAAADGLPELGSHPYVCLHPGARALDKRWPVERFAAVGDNLAQQGMTVVITGNGAEHELAQSLQAAMRYPAINAALDISVGALAALLAGAQLLIANDTGVSHIAAALGLPSVVIFFATDPTRWAPLNQTRHRVLVNRDGVTAAEVIAEAVALLESERR